MTGVQTCALPICQEIGVSLAHPHGQVYCYPFIAPKMEKELQHTEAYHEKTGGNLLKDIMNAELEAGERIVMRNHSWVAYVPAAARWPLEVHVAPVRDVLTLDELNDEERWDLASMYSHLLKRGNAFFDKGDGKGMDLPYIAAWHQAPIHDARRENYRLNLQFFSFRRAANTEGGSCRRLGPYSLAQYLSALDLRHIPDRKSTRLNSSHRL